MTPRDTRSARRRALADRRWRAFCRALGYPDPDTITQERKIWPASVRIATRAICSASSMRKVAVTSPEIQQIVTEVYTSHDLLPSEWTPQRQRDFLDREAARLSRQVAEVAADLSEHAIQEWISRTGDHPDVMTKVGLVNNATLQAKEIVLNQELYELIPPPPEEDLEVSRRCRIAARCRGIGAGHTPSTGPIRPRIKRTW